MGVPDPEQGDFILDCDACDVGKGGVLSKIQDGRERVLYYGSRTLNKSERNYCVTDKELLAVRYFVDYFRQYLLGRHFLVRTDHQALVWLFHLKDPKGRVASKCKRKATVMDEQVRKPKTRKQSAGNELPGETTAVPKYSHAESSELR
ncbi:hypothetical protein FSP39_006729 [Pinctada imbricata]|uniref:Reverse transcriptase RNase H-like domain-containing protein n=1 Tax=Pinctada imbricata TaxID=66713 RepID=A0AA88XYJ2_PINIB|nr:hypothetical protein FSP39_006729 [Pinctada imbricata]